MARQGDQRRFVEWLQRLRRFEKSGLTISQFCAHERVSVPTFGYWRRKCAGVAASPLVAPATFKSVEVVGGRAVTLRDPGRCAAGDGAEAQAIPPRPGQH
jgi:hypothetical protein